MEYLQSLLKADAVLPNDWESMKNHPTAKDGQKSKATSIAFRLKGNLLLKQKKHSNLVIREILTYFCKSIAYAEPNSEELALSFGNRSVLLLHINKYDLCLVDVDRALNIATSPLFKAKLLIRKISCLNFLEEKVDNSIILEAQQSIKNVQVAKFKEQLTELLKQALAVKPDTSFRPHSTAPLPKISQSKEMPCASDAVEIKYDETFGRHLTVNRLIPPGEILMIEDAYAAFPSLKERYLICANCIELTLNGIPCDFCTSVIFCSDSCKDIAWKKYHKIECPYLGIFINLLDDANLFQFFLRTVIIAMTEKDFKFDIEYVINENSHVEKTSDKRIRGFTNGQLRSDKFRGFCSIQDHKDKLDPYKSRLIESCSLRVFRILKPIISAQLKSKKPEPHSDHGDLKEILEKIRRILESITFGWQKSDGYLHLEVMSALGLRKRDIFDEVYDCGAVIGICSSLINHSCVPNAYPVFKNGKIVILSSRPIRKNEQIFVTYLPFDMHDDRKSRRLRLQQSFFFACNCLACTENVSAGTSPCVIWKVRKDFRQYCAENSLAAAPLDRIPNDYGLWYTELQQNLLKFVKIKLSEICYTKSRVKALVDCFTYEKIFRDLHCEMYNGRITMDKCC